MNHRVIKHAELVLPYGMYSQIREYLFRDLSREYLCYLLCGHTVIGQSLRLLGCYLVIPDDTDIVSQSLTSVGTNKGFLKELLQECERLGLSLIDIHSHPFSSSTVSFSSIDDRDELEKAEWFHSYLPHCFYGSIVMGTNGQKARIHISNKKLEEQNLVIKPLQLPLRTNHHGSIVEVETFDRQIRAFGREGQEVLSNAVIGIVGLGGLGAGLAVQLARLGVKGFKLFDPDRVSLSNLNRVSGLRRIDTRLGTHKVDVVARYLWEIDPTINCERVKRNIAAQNSWRRLRDVDLIITATDNHSSRMLVNMVSQMYLVPQVSVGTLISTDSGLLDGAHGHVFIAVPGHNQPCTLCADIINPTEVYYELSTPSSRKQAARMGYIDNYYEPAPSVSHLNGVVINLACVEIHNLFCGFKEFSKHLVYSLLDQEIYSITEKPRNCASCSEGGGIFGRGDLVLDPLSDILSAFAPRKMAAK